MNFRKKDIEVPKTVAEIKAQVKAEDVKLRKQRNTNHRTVESRSELFSELLGDPLFGKSVFRSKFGNNYKDKKDSV